MDGTCSISPRNCSKGGFYVRGFDTRRVSLLENLAICITGFGGSSKLNTSPILFIRIQQKL
jgi:hypothetical protein